MFIVQPISNFGCLICNELDSEENGRLQWQTFEFAVAWLNLPGAERFKDSAKGFLTRGGRIRATVGLDFSSTSFEGLSCLLALERESADITTHVFFDENRACTFHPKVFIFCNTVRARLFVGSNNMTGAGLETNVEAALSVTGAYDNETICVARQTLEMWRDEKNEARTRRLTPDFLGELLERGYVRTEEEIRARRKSDTGSRPSQGEPLFGRSTTRPARAAIGTGGGGSVGEHTNSSGLVEVLLMRVRPRRDGKQLQISMLVHKAPFVNSAETVVSAGDGSRREVGYNEARGIRNTARFEAPEMEGMTNPVARFQWVDRSDSGTGADRVLQFELFDADKSSEGSKIYNKLNDGIGTPPVTNLERLSHEATVLSKSDRMIAQWYRLDSLSVDGSS